MYLLQSFIGVHEFTYKNLLRGNGCPKLHRLMYQLQCLIVPMIVFIDVELDVLQELTQLPGKDLMLAVHDQRTLDCFKIFCGDVLW